MRELIKNLAAIWHEYYQGDTEDKNHPAFKLIYHEFPKQLDIFNQGYKHLKSGSSGDAGRITRGPWAATYDTRITAKPTEGYYLVYLFAVDMSSVTLELGFGTTQFTKFYGDNKTTRHKIRTAAQLMQSETALILKQVCKPEFIENLSTKPSDLRTSQSDKLQLGYEQASIYSKSYNIEDLPTDQTLFEDYQQMIMLYQAIASSSIVPTVSELLNDSIEAAFPTAPSPKAMVGDFIPRKPKGRRSGSSGSSRHSKDAKKIGDLGELWVLEYEKKKLIDLGRSDLAKEVIHEEAEGNRPGWDISSFDNDGNPICIEVKSSTRMAIDQIEITSNEWKAAIKHGDYYYLYLVQGLREKGPNNVELIKNPFKNVDNKRFSINPIVYSLKLYEEL